MRNFDTPTNPIFETGVLPDITTTYIAFLAMWGDKYSLNNNSTVGSTFLRQIIMIFNIS
jgi:hypothetical protein